MGDDIGPCTLAFFISPHGFGHAARACAVMEAFRKLQPESHFEVFTSIPIWFFQDSLTAPFRYHPVHTDVGLVQKNAFETDIDRTVQHLNAFLPFDPHLIHDLAKVVTESQCRQILCDIAPLGIAVARASAVPSVLIENFTWDWVYRELSSANALLTTHCRYLQRMFAAADVRIQAKPVCQAHPDSTPVAPVSRRARTPAEQIRKDLGIAPDQKIVLISSGGVPYHFAFLDRLQEFPEIVFVAAGGSREIERRENVVLLPQQSEYFHPDLIGAGDVVVAKAGYSTIAEVYAAGVPFGFINRMENPESASLADYAEHELSGLAIREPDFNSGRWLEQLPALLALPRRPPGEPNGADQIAAFVAESLEETD